MPANLSEPDVQSIASALTEDDQRFLLTKHKAMIAAIIDTMPTYEASDWYYSGLAAKFIMREPELIEEIISLGVKKGSVTVAGLNQIAKALLLCDIIRLTTADSGETFLRIFREVIAPASELVSGTRH